MGCYAYDRTTHYLHAENALRRALSQYRRVERIPITELVDKFLDNIKSLDLFNLDTPTEISNLVESFEDIIKGVKMLNDSQKKEILQSYVNEINKRFNIDPVETVTPETNVDLEIRDLPEDVNNNEENSESKVLDYEMDTLYGNAVVLKEFALNNFRKSIVNSALINFDEGRIVRTTQDLNQYIANYKNKLFKQLVDYIKYDHLLNDTKFDPNVIDYIYSATGEPNTINMDKVLKMASDVFYDVDKSRLSDAFISRHLIYRGELRNRQMIDAFNAFALLSPGNFDKTLSSLMGESFKIKEVYKGEVAIDKHKYLFEKTNALRKSWGGSENVDAVKELGSISKLLIEQTPLYSWETQKPINDNNLTLKQFLYSMNKLRDEQSLQGFEKNSKLQEYIIKFHDKPRHYLGLILEYLVKNNKAVRYFPVSDMNVYYSIYKRYFDKGEKDSLYSIMNNEYKEYSVATTQYDLLEAISGVVDRTNTAKYVQYAIDQDLGDLNVKEIRQSNNLRLRLQREHDMEITNKLRTDRAKIIGDYNIGLANATTGDISFDLKVKSNVYSFTTNAEGRVGDRLRVSRNGTPMSINNIVKEPNFEAVKNFYERMGTDVEIDSEGNQVYLELVKLSDTLLNTGFLRGNIDLLMAFKDIHEQENSITYLTESLMSMIGSAALANYMYNEFETNNTEYTDFEEFIKTYNFYNNMDIKTFEKYYDSASESLKIINNDLEPLEKLASANQYINGEVFKSVTKNAKGDNVPNSRISNLAGLTRYWLETEIRSNPKSPLNSSLFAVNPDVLMGVTIKTDAISRNGIKKNASTFTEAEHAYSSILYDFYANLLHSPNSKLAKHVYTQPAVLSDKSTLVMWKTKMKGYLYKGQNIDLSVATHDILNDLIKSTVGGYYKGTFDNVLDDYRKTYSDNFIQIYIDRLQDFATQDQLTFSKTKDDKTKNALAKRIASLNSAYERISKKISTLESENAKVAQKNVEIQAKLDEIRNYNLTADPMDLIWDFPELLPMKSLSDLLGMDDFKTIMSVTTLEEFDDMTSTNSVRNIENIHTNKGYKGTYNVEGVKTKMTFIQPNSLLIYNATKLYNEKNSIIYDKQMLREKKKFIRDLVSNNVSFPLIYSDGTSNALLNQAIKDFIPINESGKWVNGYTQELILAKIDGKDITRLNSLTNVRDDTDIELNPLLERYFLTDFLLSENLRLITTGSELAHPDKSNSTHDLSIGMAELEEGSRAGAQNKRNVIIPGTLQYYQQDSLLGITPKVRIAIMPDIGARVHNYSGNSDDVDAHDGSAFNHPVNSILENLSLQDNAAGEDKKPIGHDFSGDYGSAVLLKYATFSMYNERMRVTQMSDINQYDLFRRMSNFEWDITHDKMDEPPTQAIDYVVDLTLNIFGKPLTLKDIIGNDRLFHSKEGDHYEILSLIKGSTPTSYLITEQPVDTLGNYIGDIRTEEVTINTLFDLHAALGGIYSESLKNGELVFSDASIFAATGYVNNVGQYYGKESDYPSQSNTWQPLKYKMITALVNKSAIKVGAENINKSKTWNDSNSSLRYMSFNTKGSGIQMDADHIVVDSEHGGSTMTEFSQVISAIEANGYTHNIARGLYKDLGKVALSAIAEEEAAVQKFINSSFSEEGKSKIYEIVGTYIIKQLKNGGKDLGLAQSLVARVKAEFSKRNKNHIDDEFKIPFSDPSIFGIALSGFTSAINSAAVKRKFPGLGAVMVPAYNMIQNFVLPDGRSYSFDDIRKSANISKTTTEQYLQELQLQEETKPASSIDKILPGDRVKVPIAEVVEAAGNIPVDTFAKMNDLSIEGEYALGTLDTYENYRFFKSTFKTFYQDYTKPRNLKPQQVYWKDLSGKQHNIFDVPTVIHAFERRNDKVTKVTKDEDLLLQKSITDSFKILESGFMPLSLEQQTERELDRAAYDTAHAVGSMYGQLVMPMESGSLINEPAEMVLSKIYAEKFNLGQNDSVSNVLTQGASFFVDRHSKYHVPKTQNYQLCFTRGNGKHTYIVFENTEIVKNLTTKRLDNESYVRDEDNLYRVNSEGRKLYRAGFYDETNTYHDLVKLYISNDTNSLEEILVVKNADEALALYNSKEYDGITVNKDTSDAKDMIYETIEKGAENITSFGELKLLTEQNPINLEAFVSKLNEVNKAKIAGMAQKKYTSFQKSLEFTVARIPAQTMQSFMKMKVTQFTSSDKNVVYVSHIQTWLQGSDYDIDKAYIMGYDFDDNGIYVGWSPFFNYSSVEALKKSELLPTPNDKECRYSDSPLALDITEQLSYLNETNFYTEEALDKIVTLLSSIDDFEGNELTYDKNITEEATANYILERVNEHNKFMQSRSKNKVGETIVPKNVLPSFRNAVSSKISNVIINLKNANSAYTPINMDAPKSAAAQSILGKEASRITFTTPSSKWLMTSQNMDGKQVIGIAAVGAKVFFGTSYYFNEGLRSGDPTWLTNMFFQKVYSNLQTTIDEDGKPITVTTMRNIMANVNFDNLESKKAVITNLIEEAVTGSMSQSEVARIVKEQLGLQPDQSLVISALLSAATDNAKELILSKINAGPALAGVYLHLIMLNFSFDDIAKLMTSPTIQTINDLSKTNIFDDYHDNNSAIIDTVIKSLKEGPAMSKYLNREDIITQFSIAVSKGFKGPEKEWRAEIASRFASGRDLGDMFTPSSMRDYRFLEEFEYLQKKRADISLETFAQFEQIKDDAKETATLGRVFGLNQGMKTDLVGKLSFLGMLENALKSMEDKYSTGLSHESQFLTLVKESKPYLEDSYILSAYRTAKEQGIVKTFDIRQFLDPNNLEYRKATIAYYNCLKSVWNIFDMIDKIPHFKALYKVLFMTDIVDTKISNKFAIIDKLRKTLMDEGVTLTEDKLKGLVEYVDDVLIANWLNKENITFTLENGKSYIDNNAEMQTVETDFETFNLATDEGRATFKLWFEQSLMQDLKSGLINGRSSPKLRINYFIQGLQMAKRTDTFSRDTVTYIKLPIDMINIKTESDQANFAKYKDSFTQLKAYNIQGRPLTDWFFLYNLVTNKNNYGSDRMTTLFSTFLDENKEASVILNYEQFIGDSDYSGVVDLDSFLTEDAQIRMAPIVAKNQLYRASDKYVRSYNSATKRYDLMRKTGFSKFSPELSYSEKGLKNYYNYFVIRTPEQSRKLKTLKITSTDSFEDLFKKLGNLMSRNTINITINCE